MKANDPRQRWAGAASVFVRLALGIGFLSAVADRFGLWGAYGQADVAWGNFARFTAYAGRLNGYLPLSLLPALATGVTAAEIVFGLLLVFGWQTRPIAVLSGILLTAFGTAMAIATGPESPLSASVFSAAAGAFLLACCAEYPFSLDDLFRSRRTAAPGGSPGARPSPSPARTAGGFGRP